MYSFEQSQQLNLFLLSLGAGFILGIIYDILRTIRLAFFKGKIAIFIFDILYFVIFSLLTFLFFLAVNKGEFRAYMILGEILGFVFYYLSFGIIAKNFTDKFVLVFHKVLKTVFKILSAPFLFVFRLFSKIESKISEKYKKFCQKSNKNRKKHLQKLRLYVYNLLGIFCKQPNVKKKEGYNDEEKTS